MKSSSADLLTNSRLREYLCHVGPSALEPLECIAKGELYRDVVRGADLPVELVVTHVVDVALMQMLP